MIDRVATFLNLLRCLNGTTLVDLGSGHGKFAIAASDAGWKVTAVDARTERFPARHDITWVQSDVRDYDIPPCDVIAILGLLYHLELESQIQLLQRCRTTVILDTHLSLHAQTHLGEYSGHLYQDSHAPPTGSVGNEYSFWHTEASLLRLLENCGFSSVYVREPWHLNDRTFLLCLR